MPNFSHVIRFLSVSTRAVLQYLSYSDKSKLLFFSNFAHKTFRPHTRFRPSQPCFLHQYPPPAISNLQNLLIAKCQYNVLALYMSTLAITHQVKASSQIGGVLFMIIFSTAKGKLLIHSQGAFSFFFCPYKYSILTRDREMYFLQRKNVFGLQVGGQRFDGFFSCTCNTSSTARASFFFLFSFAFMS